MSDRIVVPKPVQKQLDALPRKQREQAILYICDLSDNPRPPNVKKLKGYPNTYRLRIGDYRVIYRIEDADMVILLLSCIHRKDAY